MSEAQSTIDEIISKDYEHGFETLLEMDVIPRGLSEDVVRLISAKKK
jgi:Fe-S cluster assembly protein SufB